MKPIRIILVETSHPGNIGASARAMKTMGQNELFLVNPKNFPSSEAIAMASGADDILEKAIVVPSLKDALVGCNYIIGASTRSRSLGWPTSTPRHCTSLVSEKIRSSKVAFIFGPEHSGLNNDDLSRCNLVVNIPSIKEFSSLNLAMAVQIICYELKISFDSENIIETMDFKDLPTSDDLATSDDLERFHAHLEELLEYSGFMKESRSKYLKLRLRRLFNRIILKKQEINILRGILGSLDSRNSKKK